MSNYYHDAFEGFQHECKKLYSALIDWENEYLMSFADCPEIAEQVESHGIDLEPLAALFNEYMFGGLGETLEQLIAFKFDEE